MQLACTCDKKSEQRWALSADEVDTLRICCLLLRRPRYSVADRVGLEN